MRLLIDGYNLLHATDLFGAGDLEGTLRGSREALLAFLADRLTERERRATVIVFDSSDAPANLPDRLDYEGIDVRFARGYADADSMIEAMLEEAVGTRQLVVVSGDRRVQRAARSHGAKPLESNTWFAELRRRHTLGEGLPTKPTGTVETNAFWVDEFTDPKLLEELEQASQAPSPAPLPPPPPPRTEPAPTPPKPKSKNPPADDFGKGISPFPPGYGEDLLEE